jgi:hypothetical protein
MDDTNTKSVPEQIQDLASRVAALEQTGSQPPTHVHNGFDSNNVSFFDVYQKKLYVHHTIQGTAAATAANYGVFLIVPVACLVTRIQEVHQTLGTDGGAVTLNIEKLTGTTALDAGSTLLPTAFNLKAAINTVLTGTLTTTSTTRSLLAGDRLAMKDSGVLTAVANVTVLVELQF